MNSGRELLSRCAIILIALTSTLGTAHAQTCVSSAVAVNSDAASDTSSHQDQAPAVATGNQGTWIAAWVESPSVSSSNLVISRSFDDGRTWSARSVLSMSGFVVDDPAIASDGGNVWIIVFEATGGDGVTGVYRRRSIDDGASWSAAQVIDPTALTDRADPAVAFDSTANRFVAFWSSRNNLGNTIGDDHDILYSRGDSLGASWSSPQAFTPNATSDSYEDFNPSAAADDFGIWNVAYEKDVCSNLFGQLVCTSSSVWCRQSFNGGFSFSGDTQLATDAGGPSVATDRNGTWVTAFVVDNSNELDIGFVRSTNNGAN